MPVIADFMREDESGNLFARTDSEDGQENSITDILKTNIVTQQETDQRLIDLQKQEPILKIENIKTWFPATKTIFGKVTEWVKAVDDVSFDVYPGETLGYLL